MKIVVFGLTISCSLGNCHATLWRGLCKALARHGHRTVFFERDVPYFASARDWQPVPECELVLYDSWREITGRAQRAIADADVAIVTSSCPDALRAGEIIRGAYRPLSVFYDLDTPATLAHLRLEQPVPYVGPEGLRGYDLVLSNTGGPALEELRCSLGARHVRALHAHVDPDIHHPVAPVERYAADLSWLGNYMADRHAALDELFARPARQRPKQHFLLGGAQYPADVAWPANVQCAPHVPSEERPAFLSSSRLTLSITRNSVAQMGWCPTRRLFEAAACGTPVICDEWSGLDEFYTPGSEILLARDADDVLAALDLDTATLKRIGQAARERTLDEHTSEHRALALIELIEEARSPRLVPPPLQRPNSGANSMSFSC